MYFLRKLHTFTFEYGSGNSPRRRPGILRLVDPGPMIGKSIMAHNSCNNNFL